MKRFKWFQTTATTILFLFSALMLLVTIMAYMRRSGSTGMDMAQIQQIRFEASAKPTQNSQE